MSKPTYTLKELRRVEISHGRATLQNCDPAVCCPHCQKPLEIFTWEGGVLIEEVNSPSPADPEHRLSFVFIPERMHIEEAYSDEAKPAITLRAKAGDIKLHELMGESSTTARRPDPI